MLPCHPCDASRLIISTIPKPLDIIVMGDLVVNKITMTAKRNGIDLHLTKKEFSLLSLLVSVPGKVWSKESILAACWGLNFDTGTNTVEVYISFLRAKCDRPFGTKSIALRSGFGYYFNND